MLNHLSVFWTLQLISVCSQGKTAFELTMLIERNIKRLLHDKSQETALCVLAGKLLRD